VSRIQYFNVGNATNIYGFPLTLFTPPPVLFVGALLAAPMCQYPSIFIMGECILLRSNNE
jgi:hypothetical protein